MRQRERLVTLSNVYRDGIVDCSNIREAFGQEHGCCNGDQSRTRGPLYQAFFLSRRRPSSRLIEKLLDLLNDTSME